MYERLLIAKRYARLVEDLDAIINDEAENSLREADGIVIRTARNVWDAVKPYLGARENVPGWVSGVRRRLPDKTVYLLREGADLCKDVLADELRSTALSADVTRFSAYRLTKGSDLTQPIFQVATKEQKQNLANEDLLDLITSNLSTVRISGGAGFHFKLPSGNHSNYFVRLAEAFRTPELLARAAYWVADAILDSQSTGRTSTRTALLIVDNPSMLAVATMAMSIAVRQDLEIVCIEGYPQTPLEKIQLASKLSVAVSRVDSALLLIGISSSGGLLSTIRESLTKIDSKLPQKLRHITLYSFSAGDPGALCRLAFPDFYVAQSGTECRECRNGTSKAIAIDPSVYYVAESEEVEIPLVPALFQAQRKFIIDYGNIEAVLRVHVEDPTDRAPRHHAFYINVGSLLKAEKAWPEIDRALDSLAPKPTAILAPEHETANLLSAHAASRLGIALFQHKTFRGINDFPLALLPQLAGSPERNRTLLIFDDVIRTGSRLKSINKALREDPIWEQLLPRISHIHFVGIVSTAESKKHWEELEKGLCKNHSWTASLQCIFEVPLPNWGTAECPWCNERELLRQLVGPEVFEKTAISDRMSRLENTSVGLVSLPFLNAPGYEDPGRAAGSAMFPKDLSAMQTLFLFASAVNQSRYLPEGINDAAFPHPRLVASRVFCQNYDERMKWKALFRALKPTEMHEGARRDIARLLAEDIVNDQEPHYFAEAFLASLRGLIRDVEPQDLLRIADQLGMGPQYVSDVVLGRTRRSV